MCLAFAADVYAERFYDALIKSSRPGVASAGQIQLRVLRLLHAGL